MSVETAEKIERTETPSKPVPRQRRKRRSTSPGLAILAQGEPFVWLTGGALVICVGMILGLLLLVFLVGTKTFWPTDIVRVELYDGRVLMGEVAESDDFRLALDAAENGPKEIVRVALKNMGDEFDIDPKGEFKVVELLARNRQVVSKDAPIARVNQGGKDIPVKAKHAGRLIELNYQAGDVVPADAEKSLARVKTSIGLSLTDLLLPAKVTEVLVKKDDQVSKSSDLVKLETADGRPVTVAAPEDGQVTSVKVEANDLVESFNFILLNLKITGEDAAQQRAVTLVPTFAPLRVEAVPVKESDKVKKGSLLAKVKTNDGSVIDVKAPAGGEVIGVFAKAGQSLQQPDASIVKLKTEGPLTIPAQRRKLQTGNFKLTNEHFNWVERYAIVPNGESKPDWAVVAERVEYGRFYGIPTEFAVRTERKLPAEEEELTKIVQFFDSKNYLLFEVSDAAAKEEPDQKSERAKKLLEKYNLKADDLLSTVQLVQPLREELKAVQKRNVAAFVKQFNAAEDVRLDAVLDSGKIVPVERLEPGQNVVEVQQVYVGPAPAWEKYQEHHREVRDRFREWYGLKKHDIGKINAREESARLRLRQKELDMREFDPATGERRQTVFISDTADSLWDAKSQEIRPYNKDLEKYDETVAAVRSRLGSEDNPLVKTARLIRDLLAREIDDLQAPTLLRMKRLRQSLEKAPESAQAVVEEYLKIKEEAQKQQDEIERRMETLVKENDRYQLRAETTSTEPLFSNVAVSIEDVRTLRNGKVPAVLKQSFQTYGAELGAKVEVKESPLQGKFYITDQSDPKRVKKRIVRVQDGKAAGMKHIWKTLSLNNIVRAYPANRLSFGDRVGIYFSRWREFLLDDPREANSAGGVFPAIWGTIAMTIIMSFIVVPFGVLASLYLREYAKGGVIVSAVRISINNLAGVPSIVFGVFGLGFFILIIGAYIDGGPEQADFSPWPPAKWFVFLAVTAAIAVGAFFVGLGKIVFKDNEKKGIRSMTSAISMLLWIVATVFFFVVIFKTPYFSGLNEAKLPNPTFGKEGMLWASLTLALLTLPVVIVATEEALSAVPNSLREGSYASGASKWQTIRRIVLPHAMPGIMTGMILAMARGAGEVAPLMLVGVKKATSELPFDGNFPYMHLDRSFMHLGFHIYDIGFQSPNSEAAKPMVYTTTLLLIGIIAFLNLAAIAIRTRLRKRFKSAQF